MEHVHDQSSSIIPSLLLPHNLIQLIHKIPLLLIFFLPKELLKLFFIILFILLRSLLCILIDYYFILELFLQFRVHLCTLLQLLLLVV